MREDDKWITLSRIELRRQEYQIVNTPAVLRGKPEMDGLRDIDLGQSLVIEMGQHRVRSGCGVQSDDLRRLNRRLENGNQPAGHRMHSGIAAAFGLE